MILLGPAFARDPGRYGHFGMIILALRLGALAALALATSWITWVAKMRPGICAGRNDKSPTKKISPSGRCAGGLKKERCRVKVTARQRSASSHLTSNDLHKKGAAAVIGNGVQESGPNLSSLIERGAPIMEAAAFLSGASIALEAANPAYETRIFGPDRIRIQGKLVNLVRKY